ncbi:hypothetical protein KAJ83_03740 [Marivibrio halodurans]|uniref:Flagellar assembly protein FliH n=1 Tax=Marivibrio halodurans TaxID=2039722 RepID=A0A8J7V1S0_9PROT|nr:hypothetical protein [Marivibrio halodurans]MBP5856107.1 hypothetical protein [Marivibrio halodurans]
MATKYKPFLFDRDFDEIDAARARRPHPANTDGGANADATSAETDAAETEEPEEPPAPTYSEEELESAKTFAFEDGRREGLEAGRKEVQDDVEAQAVEALETLAEGLTPLFEQQRLAHERASALMARIARDIFAHLMPAYVERHGEEEVVALVRDAVATLQDVGKLTVRVDETVRDRLAERLEPLVRQAGFDGKLAVIGDPAMGRSDAAVDWGTGGAERRYPAIWADIETAIARAIEGLEPDDSGDEPDSPEERDESGEKDEDVGTSRAATHDGPEAGAADEGGDRMTDTDTRAPDGAPPTDERAGDGPADDER